MHCGPRWPGCEPMKITPGQWAIVLAVLGLLALGGWVGYRQWRRARDRRALRDGLGAIAFDMVQDVLVPDGNDGYIHVDFLLLTHHGALVVDLRDLAGMVFGSEAMEQWTVMDGHRRGSFHNPLGPLYDRIAAVRQCAGAMPVDGRVVFTTRSRFPKGRPPRVMQIDSLATEFPVADRTGDPSPVAAWDEPWQAVKASALPSPLARRR